MTSVLMLARLRTLLDEASAGFWTEPEEYAALSDGQREVFNIIFKKDPHSQMLKPLLKDKDQTGGSNQAIALPSDFREFVNAKMATTTGGTKIPAKVIDYNDTHLQNVNNSYLKPITASPVVYVKGTTSLGRKIYFEPLSSNADYSITYMTNPTEISSIVEPILPSDTHESIIVYAFSFLLRKDLRQVEADSAYKLFLDMVGKV